VSRENVEIVQRAIDAFTAGAGQGDFGAAWDEGLMAPDAEYVAAPEMMEERTFRGRDGWVEAMSRWTEDFEEVSFQLDRLLDAGDDGVLGFFHQTALGRGSGVPVELEGFFVYDVEGGQIVRIRAFLDRAQALEAAGLQE
jgi:ketosteroid isomerase-like protein